MRKTHIAKFLGAAMALTMAFTGCASNGTSSTASDSAADGSAAEGAKRIGVIQYASHPSLDNCYEGVRQGLVEVYGEDGVIIDLQNGQGDGATCDSISANFVSKGYDMIYAIATPAALSAYSAANKSDIPVIFCAVSDPVAAQLAGADGTNPGAITGTSDQLPVEAPPISSTFPLRWISFSPFSRT